MPESTHCKTSMVWQYEMIKVIVKATMATLDHYKEHTSHDNCPPGKGSWCSFQKDVATRSSFHKPVQNPLPDAVVKVIKLLFDRLGKT